MARIVFTGGPAGCKTTAVQAIQNEMGPLLHTVPETATRVFQAGFPRERDPIFTASMQVAIYHLQLITEESYRRQFPDDLLLFDRGTLDGAAYWPHGLDEFFKHMNTTWERELARYDAIFFFETSARLKEASAFPARFESISEAVALDLRLQQLWSKHPKFYFIPQQKTANEKVDVALKSLRSFFSTLNLNKTAPAKKKAL